MPKYSQILLLVLCTFLLVQNRLFAVEVTDLYVAHVPISSKAEGEKTLALKKAMKAVILKVAGQPEALSHSVVKQAFSQYKLYYRQFYYQTINDQEVLTVTFDENKINAILIKAELPIWGRLRPKTLLWVVDEKGLTRNVVSKSVENYIPENITFFSETRGLPFILPNVDAVDNEIVTLSDLWGRFSEPTLTASKRYNAESVIIIRLSNNRELSVNSESLAYKDAAQTSCLPHCDMYTLDWRFISNSQRLNETLSYQGYDEKVLLNKALEDITEQVYKRYALTTHEYQNYKIDVANIDSLSDYMNVQTFLKELSFVKSVTLIDVKGSHRGFNLQLMGSPEAFLATLKLDKKLEQYIDPLAQIDPLAPPVFYWKPF